MDTQLANLEGSNAGPNRLAVSSQKGGVAKTTTCLSLGAALADQGLRVLVIDLDPQAHLTQALGTDPETLRRTVGDVLLFQATLAEVSRETPVFNMDLIPSNKGLILVERVLHTTKGYEFRLRTALEALKGRYYDMVLVDCPPSFGPLTINALAMVEAVILPITCDVFSMHSLQTTLNLLRIARQKTNPVLEHRMLVTMFDARTRLSKLFLEQYRQKFGNEMFETIIPVDAKLRESVLFTRTVLQHAKSSRSANEYRALARELMIWLKVTI